MARGVRSGCRPKGIKRRAAVIPARLQDVDISARFLSPQKVLTRRDILQIFRLLKSKCRLRSVRLTCVVASDREMRRLNRRFHGRDRSTDVLAFDLGPATEDGRRCADVVVNAERARRVARRLGVPVREEMVRYIVHGVLHLTGYDDATPRGRRRMEQRQEALVRLVMRRVSRKR